MYGTDTTVGEVAASFARFGFPMATRYELAHETPALVRRLSRTSPDPFYSAIGYSAYQAAAAVRQVSQGEQYCCPEHGGSLESCEEIHEQRYQREMAS